MSEIIIAVAIAIVLFWTSRSPAKSMSDIWTINDVIDLVRSTARQYGVNPDFAQAICEQESGYKIDAINPNDPSYGLMQLTLPVAKYYSDGKITDTITIMQPDLNVEAGIKFIADLLRKYKSQSLWDIASMYNTGETKYHKGFRNAKYADAVIARMNRIITERREK